MREIKFRLIEKGKIVGYERWNSLAGKWCYDTKADGNFDIRNPFIPHTDKDAFTGLKDKNGVEIYEGDKIRYMDGKDMVVEWKDGTYCGWHIHGKRKMGEHIHHYIYGLYNYGKLDNCNYNHEVIGHIHEES